MCRKKEPSSTCVGKIQRSVRKWKKEKFDGVIRQSVQVNNRRQAFSQTPLGMSHQDVRESPYHLFTEVRTQRFCIMLFGYSQLRAKRMISFEDTAMRNLEHKLRRNTISLPRYTPSPVLHITVRSALLTLEGLETCTDGAASP